MNLPPPPGAADQPPPHHASIVSGTFAAARCRLTLVEAARLTDAVAAAVRRVPCTDLSSDDFLNNKGVISVLLETPSGFAIFYFCGLFLYAPDAVQSLWVHFSTYSRARKVAWLKEFQTFADKSSAIDAHTGIDAQLTKMIMKSRSPGEKLLVGNREYKSIIEKCLGIPCLHNEIVMEIMWGMQHLMRSLVRREKSELPKEDRLPMSQGLQMLLSRYGFDVEPKMVNLPAGMLLLYALVIWCHVLQ